MQSYRNLTYTRGQPIDLKLQALHDRDRFFTVRPSVAFQRTLPAGMGLDVTVNPTEGTGDVVEWSLSRPYLVHDITENLIVYKPYYKEGFTASECAEHPTIAH
eukprot:CAMPEP_0181235106 /NCGR_PEP_ID=MMETSP1096-20121128/37379_1 /TAXON_ID=156174 ORGANISM="Chrysochromulina ericina, Strain CCMP281" /NCGR_SAMPLE_ID=MMETSP1096 /ASSEMBLY_ACC=CAM_ASM_000453 /LENGTH=102 /DNA_ID=CAMNT_0023330025 /DNA_START=133 /DNA_END=441 /DNA_ORIENTATION=-